MKVVRLRFDEPFTPGDHARPFLSNRPDHPRFASELVLALEGEVGGQGTLFWVDSPLEELAYLTARLLGPGGCPWDQEQTHTSLKKHLLEETYEVLDAIDSGDPGALREELGDLLLQPIMHAQMAETFDVDAVAQAIVDKLVRRHPHVFGDAAAGTAEEVLRQWDRIKAREQGDAPASILAGVPEAMPALLRAHEVSKRAARNGFEWPHLEAVFEKLDEEVAELRDAISVGEPGPIEAEIGDLLFTVVNVARWLRVEPEDALRLMLARFTRRFQAMERIAGGELQSLSPEEWDALWTRAKQDG
jgi:MazG family protein